MDIYDKMIKHKQEIDHHESDLYVKVTDISKEIVEEYKYKTIVTTFISQIDNCLWYDIPFAYKPFWDKKFKRGG